jgi:hypothetical protein
MVPQLVQHASYPTYPMRLELSKSCQSECHGVGCDLPGALGPSCCCISVPDAMGGLLYIPCALRPQLLHDEAATLYVTLSWPHGSVAHLPGALRPQLLHDQDEHILWELEPGAGVIR